MPEGNVFLGDVAVVEVLTVVLVEASSLAEFFNRGISYYRDCTLARLWNV
jgi:hypothetical protein